MKIINSYFNIEDRIKPEEIMKKIERAARTCYKSEEGASEKSYEKLIRSCIKRGHESVLEHEKLTIRFVCDRGISHELVRHRLASYSQESTRYCNYSANKFSHSLTFIRPSFWKGKKDEVKYEKWKAHMKNCELLYFHFLSEGAKPEEARSILPNSLKTEIVVTMNFRELRNFLHLRTQNDVHPDMLALTRPLLTYLQKMFPPLFEDIKY